LIYELKLDIPKHAFWKHNDFYVSKGRLVNGQYVLWNRCFHEFKKVLKLKLGYEYVYIGCVDTVYFIHTMSFNELVHVSEQKDWKGKIRVIPNDFLDNISFKAPEV
jgi:hypothetical protein